LGISLTTLATSIGRLLLVAVIAGGSCTVFQGQQRWVGSWASSQQLVEPRNSIPATDLKDVTLRQIVHLTIGGSELRLHLSNRYGTTPLHIASAHIARASAPVLSRIMPASDQLLTFSGRGDVTIPAGADYLSDPVSYSVTPLSDVAITIHLDLVPVDQTGHPGSRATSYLAHGGQAAAVNLPDAAQIEHWYFIEGIDVQALEAATAVVILGDSITDGHGATTNGNDRWPDILARRLQAAPQSRMVGVLNHGIGGNRLLLDGLGPNALARFNADVIAQAGVRYLVVLEGINDIGMLGRSAEATVAQHRDLVNDIVAAYDQIVARAHTHGIKVAGGTILPFAGSDFYHPGPQSEADRQAVNKWIRESGHFDTVIDFDEIVRDPTNPDRLLPKFDSGDHLHPSPAGYAAMAEAVPVAFFTIATSSLPPRPPASRTSERHQ
jgi:lysophospholipase L1-like esterase